MLDQGPHALVAASMAARAAEFLAGLDAEQRARSQLDFPSDEERRSWFYTPTDHGGMTLRDLRPHQQKAAMRLLASGLSDAGFNTATTIIGLELILERNEDWSSDFGRDRGRDPGLYYVTVFGEPGGTSPWGWRFGGHHVSVHYTILEGRLVSSTPNFFGANPATAELLGPHFLRPLGGLQDTALELMAMLDPQQRAKAIVSEAAPTDIVTANRSSLDVGPGRIEPVPLPEIWREEVEGELRAAYEQRQVRMETGLGITEDQKSTLAFTAVPIGVPVATLDADQRHCLRALLAQYVSRLPDPVADEELAAIGGQRFEGLHLAWAGPTEAGQPIYYRIQGEGLVVEFDNTQQGANHIHAVWRDPQNDFGLDVLARHYLESH